MKNLLLFIFVFLVCFRQGFSQTRVDSVPILVGRYRICGIDSIESVYIIYAQKGNPIIKIASPKANGCNCETVAIGRYYDLQLKSRRSNRAGKAHTAGVMVGNVLVRLEGDKVIWDLFRCLNMKGLCFLQTNDTSAMVEE